MARKKFMFSIYWRNKVNGDVRLQYVADNLAELVQKINNYNRNNGFSPVGYDHVTVENFSQMVSTAYVRSNDRKPKTDRKVVGKVKWHKFKTAYELARLVGTLGVTGKEHWSASTKVPSEWGWQG